MRRLDLDKLRSVCLNAVLSMTSLQEFLDAVRECIGLPTLLLDSSINAIAFSFDFPFYSPWWEKSARRAITNEDVLENKSHFFRWQNLCSKEILLAPSTIDGKDITVIGPVICNDKLVATCGILVRDADTDDAIEAFKLYSHTLSIKMRYMESVENMLSHESSVESILLGDSSELAAEKYPPGYSYAVFRVNTNGIAELQFCQNALSAINHPSISCIDRNSNICMLFYDIQSYEQLNELHSICRDICTEFSLKGGFSDIFTETKDISIYRTQATLALSESSGNSLGGLSCFSDNYVNILLRIALEYFGPHCVVLPEISKLIQIDGETNRNFVQTLEALSSGFFDSSVAAKSLGIHKNTMLTRLKKIEDILGDNKISDTDYTNNFSVGLDISRYISDHKEIERSMHDGS